MSAIDLGSAATAKHLMDNIRNSSKDPVFFPVEISAAGSGPDAMIPGLELTDPDGNRLLVPLISPEQVASLGEALGVMAAMLAARLASTQFMIHDHEDIGCKESHRIASAALKVAHNQLSARVQPVNRSKEHDGDEGAANPDNNHNSGVH